MPRALTSNPFDDASYRLADMDHSSIAHKPSPFASRQWRHRGTKAMPKDGKEFHSDDATFGWRVAAFLRGQFPKNTEKRAATAGGASLHTAKKWLDGTPPSRRHLFALLAYFGWDFAAVMFESIDDTMARAAALHAAAEKKEQAEQEYQRLMEEHRNK